MNKIIKFKANQIERTKYMFKAKNILLHSEDGTQRLFFCIVLIEKKTKDIVAFTGLEKYVVDSNIIYIINESTYRYSISRVINFLNFILYNTKINKINEISIEEIREFLKLSQKKPNGEDKKSDTWERIRNDIFVFLKNYYKYHADKIDFKYNINDLIQTTIIKEKNAKQIRRIAINNYNSLNVKAPTGNDHKIKKRALMYGHLEAILYAAKMYDPMLYLAINLMAYAGLREGEVVSLSFEDIIENRTIGVLDKITINLNKSDRYRKGKTPSGAIKKIREQRVYDDFLPNVEEALKFHKDYLYTKGLFKDGESPIFYNKHGNAMSVTTLTTRIRNLFNNYFLKILKQTSIGTEFQGETQAYIEAYEDEYPGAHMFRHWFTMYLITKKNLRPELVREIRGDAPNSDSYEQYIHLNSELIKAYKNTVYSFQEHLLGDIYE